MNVKEAVRRQFAPVAANYAASAVHAGGADLEAMLAAAAPRGDERVLDVGCGAGHTALAFASHAREVVAVDITEAMLGQGRALAAARGLTNVVFQAGDVECLPFPDRSFDIVTSRYSAHHYPHSEQAVREVARVLKPGGVFLLDDVVSPPHPASDAFLNGIEALRDPSHVRDRTLDEWRRLLEGGGFAVEIAGEWPLRLEFQSWVTRMNTPPDAVARIRELMDGAPVCVRDTLMLEADGSFTVSVACLRGARRV